jgi:hypothetical protein
MDEPSQTCTRQNSISTTLPLPAAPAGSSDSHQFQRLNHLQ